MNSKLLFLSLLAIAGTGLFLYANSSNGLSASTPSISSVAQFATFKVRYGKTYNSMDEAAYRFTVFAEKLAQIEKHNADPTQSYTLGINEFSDMTIEELTAQYLTTFPENRGNSKCEKQDVSEVSTDENHVDWNEAGKVQVVKNQGQCGSCWAFASVGGLESAYAISKNELPSLSEQELVDCSRNYGNYGCSGGLMSTTYDYILDHHINTEVDYPYKAQNGVCQSIAGQGKYGLRKCVQVDSDVKALVDSIRKQPVAIAFYVQTDFFSYAGGIYNPYSCPGRANHAVLAVGFHIEEDSNKSYFIVKNSWGTTWGEKGFFKIVIGKGTGTCNIAGSGWNYYPVV